MRSNVHTNALSDMGWREGQTGKEGDLSAQWVGDRHLRPPLQTIRREE
jgi:hypothetical protein